jgi:DNA-binding MurR/RpiR family transcriptional regulator
MAKSKRQLEAKLTAQQRKAALLLVENELTDNSDAEKKSQDEIAEEVGVGRMTLYRWRTQNDDFRDYKNLLADDFLSEQRAYVYKQLMKSIGGAQPSIKGIDLFLRRHGLLTDRVVTEDTTGNTNSNEDIAKETEELDKLLNEED